jgi:hypothetical protein
MNYFSTDKCVSWVIVLPKFLTKNQTWNLLRKIF